MSKSVGGYLRGPWWRFSGDEEKDIRRCYIVAWGNIVKEPSEQMRDLRQTKFVIKCGRGAEKDSKYILCTAYGERSHATIMRAMEKGDVIFCAGTWVERMKVKTKKGVKKTFEMMVHFIVPQELIGFLLALYGTPEVQKMVEAYQNGEADPWESE